MTFEAAIRFAPLTTAQLLSDPKRSKRTMYDRLTFLPGKTSVPLLVDHDDSKEIGRVNMVFPFEDADGRWLVASATLTERPAWLGRGTPASFEYKPLQISSFGDGIVRSGLITEVSVLTPGTRPAEPLACVAFVKPTEKPKPPPPTVIRRAVPAARGFRLVDETDELRRRQEFYEGTGVPFEMILENLRHELQASRR